MVIFCWVFRRHQYSVVLNILGNTLAAAFPLEAMMSGPDLERPTPGRGNVFSGKRWWWCQSGKIKIYCMTFWCGDTSIPCDHSIWVWCSMFKTVSFQKQPHSLKHVLLEHAECPPLKKNINYCILFCWDFREGFAKETRDFLMNTSHGTNVDVVYSLNFRWSRTNILLKYVFTKNDPVKFFM